MYSKRWWGNRKMVHWWNVKNRTPTGEIHDEVWHMRWLYTVGKINLRRFCVLALLNWYLERFHQEKLMLAKLYFQRSMAGELDSDLEEFNTREAEFLARLQSIKQERDLDPAFIEPEDNEPILTIWGWYNNIVPRLKWRLSCLLKKMLSPLLASQICEMYHLDTKMIVLPVELPKLAVNIRESTTSPSKWSYLPDVDDESGDSVVVVVSQSLGGLQPQGNPVDEIEDLEFHQIKHYRPPQAASVWTELDVLKARIAELEANRQYIESSLTELNDASLALSNRIKRDEKAIMEIRIENMTEEYEDK